MITDECGRPVTCWGGLRIIESPYVPTAEQKLKLRPDVHVTDKFRAEMDAWLMEMFGTRTVAYIFNTGIHGGIVMNPANVVKICLT